MGKDFTKNKVNSSGGGFCSSSTYTSNFLAETEYMKLVNSKYLVDLTDKIVIELRLLGKNSNPSNEDLIQAVSIILFNVMKNYGKYALNEIIHAYGFTCDINFFNRKKIINLLSKKIIASMSLTQINRIKSKYW